MGQRRRRVMVSPDSLPQLNFTSLEIVVFDFSRLQLLWGSQSYDVASTMASQASSKVSTMSSQRSLNQLFAPSVLPLNISSMVMVRLPAWLRSRSAELAPLLGLVHRVMAAGWITLLSSTYLSASGSPIDALVSPPRDTMRVGL